MECTNQRSFKFAVCQSLLSWRRHIGKREDPGNKVGHVAIICDQSNSLLKMLMVDAQKLSRTSVRQIILLFAVPQEDLIQARSQMIFYNVTLRLGRNLRKGKVVLSTCFLFSCFRVPSDDACSSNTKLCTSQWKAPHPHTRGIAGH